MITSQPSYVGNPHGEVVAGNAPGQPVIPTQHGTSPNRPAVLVRSEQKPILSPWMKTSAKFASKVNELGKWTLRAVHHDQTRPPASSRHDS
jgi:hypothetical protein